MLFHVVMIILAMSNTLSSMVYDPSMVLVLREKSNKFQRDDVESV